MTTQRDIKNTYFDALFFASSTINEGKDFHLTPAQFRLFLKLIHYSTHEENITWSSENISKHLCTSIDSIDKSIQRLRQKGYINVINKQRNATNRSRTIYINWEFILEVDGLFKNHLDLTEEIEVSKSEIIQPEPSQPELVESDEMEIQEEEEQEESKLSIADLINQLPPVPLDEIENISNIEKITKQDLINFTENTNLDKNDKRIIFKNIESGKIKSKEDLQESITLIKILN